MLDRMRRHQNYLKWILGIVVVAFVFIYVPAFIKPAGLGATPDDTLDSFKNLFTFEDLLGGILWQAEPA